MIAKLDWLKELNVENPEGLEETIVEATFIGECKSCKRVGLMIVHGPTFLDTYHLLPEEYRKQEEAKGEIYVTCTNPERCRTTIPYTAGEILEQIKKYNQKGSEQQNHT